MPNVSVLSSPSSTSEPEELAVLRSAMRRSPYRALHELVCDVEEGGLVLRGIVRTWYLKQLAQEIARKCLSSGRFVNAIEVRW
jgi:hypothetical protein